MLKSLPCEKSLSKLSDRSEKSTAHPTAHTMGNSQTQEYAYILKYTKHCILECIDYLNFKNEARKIYSTPTSF